jgi:hypothetical protein
MSVISVAFLIAATGRAAIMMLLSAAPVLSAASDFRHSHFDWEVFMLRPAVISLLAFLSILYNASGQNLRWRSGRSADSWLRRPGHQFRTPFGQRSICRQFHEADLC